MLAAIGLSIKNDSNYLLTLYGMSDFNEQYRQETIVDKAVYQVPFNYGRLLTDFAALALSLKGLSLSESGIAFSVAGTGGSGGTASAITVPVGVVSVAGYVASVDIGIAAISNFISFFKEGVSVGGPKNNPGEGGLNSPSEINTSSKQFGEKWGKHKTDYPELNMDGYKDLIDDVFYNPDKIIYDATNNEFLYLKGNDLLRVTETGDFISLYPGAETGRVTSALESGGLIWPK